MHIALLQAGSPYSPTFLSAALIKASIGLGKVSLITSGFSLPDPREK